MGITQESKVSPAALELLGIDEPLRVNDEWTGHEPHSQQFVMSLPSRIPLREMAVREHFSVVCMPSFSDCWASKSFDKDEPIL